MVMDLFLRFLLENIYLYKGIDKLCPLQFVSNDFYSYYMVFSEMAYLLMYPFQCLH